jgi:hypothetical protein
MHVCFDGRYEGHERTWREQGKTDQIDPKHRLGRIICCGAQRPLCSRMW